MKFNRALPFILFPLAAFSAFAQTFSSGSTGADGALSFTTPGTYVFNPKSYNPPLNPAGDNIFNFTTINIAAGVTVQLSGTVFNSPVVWLAQGAVTINGTIDGSGQSGLSASNTTQRSWSIPGAGGYPGGYPAVGSNPAGSGLGPAGGTVWGPGCASEPGGANGGFTGNQFLVPLVGGSGGGGYGSGGGGAGGGAILIASSTSISGSGSINATGGNGKINGTEDVNSGAGAGGGIRLVAPTVSITGLLTASGGRNDTNDGCNNGSGAPGVVRVEAFTIGAITASGNLHTATPYGLYLSAAGVPTISVTSVGGLPVATSPTGTFTVPDVIVNSNSPLLFAIQASNVPLGTLTTLTIFSENGPDQTVQSTPLAGTLASSTATASVTLPSGFSKGFVKAIYTQ